MSKQSEAKAAQGYTKNPRQCNKCANYSVDTHEENNDYYGIRVIEKNKRCKIGVFAVQSSASCNLFALKYGNES